MKAESQWITNAIVQDTCRVRAERIVNLEYTIFLEWQPRTLLYMDCGPWAIVFPRHFSSTIFAVHMKAVYRPEAWWSHRAKRMMAASVEFQAMQR